MNLLEIPLNTIDPVDIRGQISEAISRECHQSPSAFSADLDEIHTFRCRIEKIRIPISTANCDDMASYFNITNELSKKLDDKLVQVTWNGQSRHSMEFEQANVLIQWGLAYMDMGYQSPKSNDEEYKNAVACYQSAAGCFQHALDKFRVDIVELETSFLLRLLLAQAQEIVWLKAVRGELKDSAIARLLQGVSQLYSDCVEYASDLHLSHIQIKHLHFAAAAMFRHSKVMQETHEYGQQVASLKCAENLCAAAAKYTEGIESTITKDLIGLTNAIKDQCRNAKRENNFVHMQAVPLAPKPIVSRILCVPITPPQLYKGTDAFRNLVPAIVESISQAFSKRAHDFVASRFNRPVQELNFRVVTALDSKNLPSKLDTVQHPENIPASILKYAKELSDAGGSSAVAQSLERLAEARQSCRVMKNRCASSFVDSSPPESLATKLDFMGQYLEQAEKGDDIIAASFSNLRPRLQAFDTIDLLKKYIPNATYSLPSQKVQNICENLRTVILKGDSLKSDRREILVNLMSKVKQEPIGNMVLEAYKTNPALFCDENGNIDPASFENIYDTFTDRYTTETGLIENSYTAQDQWERDLESAHSIFSSEVTFTHESQMKRHQVLHSLETTYAEYKELMMRINEGFEFYNDFQNRGRAVVLECEGYGKHP